MFLMAMPMKFPFFQFKTPLRKVFPYKKNQLEKKKKVELFTQNVYNEFTRTQKVLFLIIILDKDEKKEKNTKIRIS